MVVQLRTSSIPFNNPSRKEGRKERGLAFALVAEPFNFMC
jgi:hypothetical protein